MTSEPRARSYDLVVFLPLQKVSVTVNLWARDESHASSRAITEMGGQGAVQILACELKRTTNHSGQRIRGVA